MTSVTAERDARSLDHSTLEEMRRLAVQRVLDGETQVAVAHGLQVLPRTVRRWMKAYREGGDAAIASRKATGRPPTLSKAQTARLKRTITGKNPAQLNLVSRIALFPAVGDRLLSRTRRT